MNQKPTKLTAVRRPKQETPDDLARQMVETEAAKAVILPPLTPDEELEAEGKRVTLAMTRSHLDAAAVYHRIYEEKLHERRGFVRPGDYFETIIGVSWRTAQMAIAIFESYLAIPEGDRGDARAALEEVGVYRAAVVAPVIREHPEQWVEWANLAADKGMTREALQERVSKARGLPPKKGTDGDRLYNTFAGRLDGDQREEFEDTYRALKLITESDDFVINTLIAYREGKTSWLATAERIRTGHGNA